MIKPLLSKIRPASGISHVLYLVLKALLPLLVFVLVRLSFVQLALVVIVLAKWRMFAMRPRFWPAVFRANAVDLIVGVSTVLFMTHTSSVALQFGWALLYSVWLVYLKPKTSNLFVALQAAVGQLAGLSALYLSWANGPLYGLVFLTGLICFFAAHHYFDSFDEPYARLLSYLWGYFGAALAWLLGHWLLFYRELSQPTLLLTALGYGMAVLYYLDYHDKLNSPLKRQFIFMMVAVVIIVLALSDWGDKTV
ncbi:MAG TPA: hypothetical protein VFN56_01835 [Candidatus Saccharimonadales bacterium]|nr:hypothetical protein [Candidatus Saccharimonadales bacterium]